MAEIRKVAVILPKPYEGGVLRATKNIARMIQQGSRDIGGAIQVVLAIPAGAYDVESRFGDVLAEGIQLREVTPRLLGGDAIGTISKLAGLDESLQMEIGLHYRDGVADLLDCQVWFVMTNRTVDENQQVHPLIPLRPVVLIPFDFIEQYVPDVVPDANTREAIAKVTRSADLVLVTQPQTARDAVSFAGCSINQVVVVPFEFDLTQECVITGLKGSHPRRHAIDRPASWIWPTNTSIHKNHGRIFRGINEARTRRVETHGRMTGPFVEAYLWSRDEAAQLGPAFMENWKLFTDMRVNETVDVLGYLDDLDYFEQLRRSDFLVHGALYDNGAYAFLEAAYLGVPCLSADYPQMRFLAELTGIPAIWFDPYDPRSFADGLAHITVVNRELAEALPDAQRLMAFGWQAIAKTWWKTVQFHLERLDR